MENKRKEMNKYFKARIIWTRGVYIYVNIWLCSFGNWKFCFYRDKIISLAAFSFRRRQNWKLICVKIAFHARQWRRESWLFTT